MAFPDETYGYGAAPKLTLPGFTRVTTGSAYGTGAFGPAVYGGVGGPSNPIVNGISIKATIEPVELAEIPSLINELINVSKDGDGNYLGLDKYYAVKEITINLN